MTSRRGNSYFAKSQQCVLQKVRFGFRTGQKESQSGYPRRDACAWCDYRGRRGGAYRYRSHGGGHGYASASFDHERSAGGRGREDIEDIVALMVTGRSVGQFQFSREGTLYPVLGVAANRLGQYIGRS